MINPFKETVDHERNKILAEHCKNYCDKKCPSGDKGCKGWHDPKGDCAKCNFNPYTMGVVK